MGVVGLAENIATQPSLAVAWAELGNIHFRSYQYYYWLTLFDRVLCDLNVCSGFRLYSTCYQCRVNIFMPAISLSPQGGCKNWKKSGADISLGVSCLFIGESHLNQGRHRKQDSYAGKLNQTEMQVTIIQYLHCHCQGLICVDQGPRAE